MARIVAGALIWLSAAIAIAAQTQPVGSADDFIGGYQSPSGEVARVILEGERLFRVAPDGERVEVAAGTPLTFLRDTHGRATHMVVGQEKWSRIVVPVSTLARYAGVYPLSPKLSMTVRLEGDRLTVQATGASKHPIHPVSPTRFFVQDSASRDAAELEFGGVDQGAAFVIVRQDGGEQKVMRR